MNYKSKPPLMTASELHAHVFMDGIDYKKCVEMNKTAPDEVHIRNVFNAYKEKGITFVREGGDHFGVALKAKEIAPEYGITYIIPVYALYKEGNYGRVAGVSYTSAKAYARLVSEAKTEGADFIKLMLSGILDFNRFGVVSESEYSLSEIKELVNIAHDEGFAVMAHVSGTENILRAIDGGIDSLEHGYYINDEGIAALAETGCVWVPTAVTGENLKGRGRFYEAAVEKITDKHKENIRKGYEAGVYIGCGSDAGAFGVMHGSGACQEYALLCGLMEEDGPGKLEEAAGKVKQRFAL